MKIFKSPTIDIIIADYNYMDRHHRSIASMVAFDLSTGKILDNAQQEIAKIYEKYPELIIDRAMPKPIAEWSIYGNVYRDGGSNGHTLIDIRMGNLQKNVLADFSETEENAIPLNNPEFNKHFYQYDPGNINLSRPVPNSFCELDDQDPERIKYAGTYDETTWLKLPNDFDYKFDNSSPLDQRQSSQWQFGEHYSLSGVGINGKFFSGDLPFIHLQLLTQRFRDDHETSDFMLGNTIFDTVKFFPDLNMGLMIFHSLFELDNNREFDTLLALDLDLMNNNRDPETVPEVNYNECLKIVLDLHKKELAEEVPTYEIIRKKQEIQKESRKIKHTRYCNVFMDYYRYTTVCEEIPIPMELTGDRLRQFIHDPNNEPELTDQQYKIVLTMNSTLQRQIETQDYNFHAQISALIEKCKKYSHEQEFRDWLNTHDLKPFSEKMYFVSFNKEPIECNLREFGVDDDGKFTIPRGIVIPSYIGEKFINAAVFSIEHPEQPPFVIPGGENKDAFSWFSALRDQFNVMFLCTSITDALRLNEETYHYLSSFYMTEPSQEIAADLEKHLDAADFVLVPAPDGKENEVYEYWHQRFANLVVIPLGKDGDEQHTPFKSIHDRIFSEESLETWLQPYMPLEIIEPDYLSDDDYTGAINHAMAKKMKITPGKFDFDAGKLRELEAKREEALKYCPNEMARNDLNKAFDNAKANLSKYQNMSEQEIREIYIKTQEDLINNVEKNLKKPGVPIDKYTPFVKPDEIVQFLRDQLESTKATMLELDQVEEAGKEAIIEVQKERQEERQKELELAVQEYNLKEADLLLLKEKEIYDNEKLYINNRDYSGIDISKMKLRNSTFDRVKFCNADLSMVDFSGSTFNECDFSGAILRFSKWDNVTLVLSKFNKSVMENGHFENTQFLGGEISDLSVSEAEFSGVRFSTTKVDNLEINKSKMTLVDFEFTNITNSRINDSNIESVTFMRNNLKNFELTGSKANKFKVTDCNCESYSIGDCSLEEFSAESSKFENLTMSNNHFMNVSFVEVNAIATRGNRNIYDDLYISGSDFSDSDFSYAIMKESYITENTLRNINFTHANLFMSNLTKNAFGKTNFAEANLFSCDVCESKFKENNFKDANLKRTAIEYQSIEL